MTSPVATPPAAEEAPLDDLATKPTPTTRDEREQPARRRLTLWLGVLALIALLVLVPLFAVPALGRLLKPKEDASAATAAVNSGATLPDKNDPNLIEMPAAVVKRLGVQSAPLSKIVARRPLILSGSLNYDIDFLARVHSRFPGEVVEITKMTAPGLGGMTEERPVSFGDRVTKGQLLAVVWCKDLGEKKSDLVDAIVKLALDEELLSKYQELLNAGNIPEATVRGQQAQVDGDRNALNRAERTLATWRVPQEEIDAVRREAKEISLRKGKRDAAKETDWARVEIRAPFDGVVVEKNVAVHDIVDVTNDLFKVADVTHLAVWAHAYEESLPVLEDMLNKSGTGFVPWTVRVSAGEREVVIESAKGFERIAPSADPTQHTVLVIGRMRNKMGEYRVGQYVTATVELEPPTGVVSVPSSALIEDGDVSLVFVQPKADASRYLMRRVLVSRRFAGMVYVRSVLTDDEKKAGLQELHADERIVTEGGLEIREALRDLQNRAADKSKN